MSKNNDTMSIVNFDIRFNLEISKLIFFSNIDLDYSHNSICEKIASGNIPS